MSSLGRRTDDHLTRYSMSTEEAKLALGYLYKKASFDLDNRLLHSM